MARKKDDKVKAIKNRNNAISICSEGLKYSVNK